MTIQSRARQHQHSADCEVDRLRLRVQELTAALRGLHDDNVDYLRLNHLSGYDNFWLKAAREALRE
jgi:hypothetical protein